jgi:hypothetical protein
LSHLFAFDLEKWYKPGYSLHHPQDWGPRGRLPQDWGPGGRLPLLIAGLVVDRPGIFGQSGERYEDPQGRFTMQIDPNWERVETDGDYTQFKLPDPPIHVYVLVCEPGKVSQYSNPHYLALARIIEEISGESYETYVIDHILIPQENA